MAMNDRDIPLTTSVNGTLMARRVVARIKGSDPSGEGSGRRLSVPAGGCAVMACTVQGMARVRSGQARPCPEVSDRSVRRGLRGQA